jgi:hypothetical protein
MGLHGQQFVCTYLGIKNTTIIFLNGKRILIRDCLHFPMPQNPLYSFRAHQQHQNGCGFLGMNGMGMFVFSPLFILKIDTAVDCHLSYQSLGCLASLSLLDYIQPISTVLVSTTKAPPLAPALIEPDDSESITPTVTSQWPKKPPHSALINIDLSLIPPPAFLVKLRDLDREELLRGLYLAESTHLSSNNDVSNRANDTNSTDKTDSLSNAHPQLDCMNKEDIIAQLDQPGTILLPIYPSNCPNGFNTKLPWTPEKLLESQDVVVFATTTISSMSLKMDTLSTLVNSQFLLACTRLSPTLQEAKQSIKHCPVTLTSST